MEAAICNIYPSWFSGGQNGTTNRLKHVGDDTRVPGWIPGFKKTFFEEGEGYRLE